MAGCIARFWAAGLALAVLSAGQAASAGEIRYLAWNGEQGTALVQSAAGTQWVALGDPVPGFGNVASIDATHIVFERVLTEAERAALESQGAIGHWADQIEVLRWDLRFHGIPVAPTGPNP